ncbi:HNH endonuclease [bacterium]|nr:HNH endonuclease [Synechococcaceae bacterium WB6_1A_059]NDG31757.1 HNH endonuclease [bacterium]NDG79515.1 HNH endonuclease [Synechococcaceae bacterium WB8_1B_057]
MTCLILNSDTRPVSLVPLSTISWEESIKYLVIDKAIVLEWYDNWIVKSPSWSTKVPAVMMLKEYQKKKTGVRFSKHNVFLRDKYICQYCGITVNKKTATLDHILPVSHGGKTQWENTCCSCMTCNSKKGNNKKIKPISIPYKPSYYELAEKRKAMRWDYLHSSWGNYLE